MANVATGFPSGPFVDPRGEVTDVWRRYLLTLDARTGGRLGTDAADNAARITAETAARAAGDVALTSGLAAERAARETAGVAEAAARVAGDVALAVSVGRGSVTRVDTGAGLSGGPIISTGTIVADWTADPVSAVTANLSIAAGTLDVVSLIATDALPASGAAGMGAFVFGGAGDGVGAGGELVLLGGTGGAMASGGGAGMTGGDAGVTAGDGGGVYMTAGRGQDSGHRGGNVSIDIGTGLGGAGSGNLFISNLPAIDPAQGDTIWIDDGVLVQSGSTASGSVTIAVPVAAATITMIAGERLLYVNPAGTIATLTIKLPPSPAAGQAVELSFGQIVTALTVQDSAAGAVATTAGAIGVAIEYRFIGAAWHKWR